MHPEGLYLGMNAKPWQTIHQASATQQFPLSAFFDDSFGRRFRYALNGSGAALVAGMIVQNAILGGAATTLQGTCAVVAPVPVVGVTRIYVTRISTDQVAGLYDEGWAAIWDNDLAAVYTRRVKTNTAIVAASTGYIDIYEPLPVDLTTSDKVSLSVNKFKNITVAATTVTGLIIGGVQCAIPISNYCWVQTRGIFGVRIKDATTNINSGPVGRAGSTDGTIINRATLTQLIGNSLALWLDEYSGLIDLCCE